MSNARSLVAVSLLAAGTLAWAALPVTGARAGAKPVLIAAIGCAVLALARLAAGRSGWMRSDTLFMSAPARLWQQAVNELLGCLAALLAAESGARLTVFRAQLPLVAAGVALTALSVAAALALPV